MSMNSNESHTSQKMPAKESSETAATGQVASLADLASKLESTKLRPSSANNQAETPIKETKQSTKKDGIKSNRKQQNAISASKKQLDEKPKVSPTADSQAAAVSISNKSSRRAQHKNNHENHNKSTSAKSPSTTGQSQSSSLEQFSARAQEIKQDIYNALEKQSKVQTFDEPIEIVQLKNDILKLSSTVSDANDTTECPDVAEDDAHADVKIPTASASCPLGTNMGPQEHTLSEQPKVKQDDLPENKNLDEEMISSRSQETLQNPSALSAEQHEDSLAARQNNRRKQAERKMPIKVNTSKTIGTDCESELAGFEPLSAKLDQETKYLSLLSSLRKDHKDSPEMLESLCKKIVQMSELIDKLQVDCEKYDSENRKLLVVKQKLENLCRELQKSNNAIRIESLDLIKLEQGKAKEQTTKIQSTLSGVIKLFDENQQRNMALRQENQELQTKLRSLLEHCDNWEKGFAAALRQKDIENRLVKTELAKSNLVANQEKEAFLKEKGDLLRLLSMMQEHQSRIEGQEAKLRLDLTNYASKYDECQAVISQGMSKFQTESKRMLKQIERSKQDYKVLLTKYESSNKRMVQLLDEKQRWDRSMGAANKKIETLEKLCRALREQKADKGDSQRQIKTKSKTAESCGAKLAEAPTGIVISDASSVDDAMNQQ